MGVDEYHFLFTLLWQLPVESDDDLPPSPDLDPEVHQLLQQESEHDLEGWSLNGVDSGEPPESSPEGMVEEEEVVEEIDDDDDEAQRAMLLRQQNLQKNRKRTFTQTKK